LLGEELSNT